MNAHHFEKLGPPALKLLGLQVWVHGRQFPAGEEPYDSDWLNVTVHCGASGASVWVSGAFLGSSSFAEFARECKVLYASLEGVAVFGSAEPELRVTLAGDRTGQIGMIVDLTPDIMDQQHRFHFALDQTFLPDIIAQCDAVLEAYPDPFRDLRADA